LPEHFYKDLLIASAVYSILCLATGGFEAPAYPANNRIVTSFPDNEKSIIAADNSASLSAWLFLTPALLYHLCGWRGLFIITGLIGILWGITWVYRDPSKHSGLNKAELKYIEKGEVSTQ